MRISDWSSDVCSSDLIQTEVFRLPTTCFAEEEGTLVNSGRWLQWHWKGAEPPGEGKSDIEIMARIYQRLLALYKKEGGKYPDPIVNLAWPHSTPDNPSAHDLAKEINGRALVDIVDRSSPSDPAKVLRKAGEQLSGFGELRDDGTTISGCWLYTGSWTSDGNQMAPRDNSDPTGIGQTLNWARCWPDHRPLMSNRVSRDNAHQPFHTTRHPITWTGTDCGVVHGSPTERQRVR